MTKSELQKLPAANVIMYRSRSSAENQVLRNKDKEKERIGNNSNRLNIRGSADRLHGVTSNGDNPEKPDLRVCK